MITRNSRLLEDIKTILGDMPATAYAVILRELFTKLDTSLSNGGELPHQWLSARQPIITVEMNSETKEES